MQIDQNYLRRHLNHIFVFGDNTLRKGKGGAAILRDEPNTYGFITKIAPNNNDESFYRPSNYQKVFDLEMGKLINEIINNPDKIYLISQLGGGLANKYKIYEEIVRPGLVKLLPYKNVKFLFPLK